MALTTEAAIALQLFQEKASKLQDLDFNIECAGEQVGAIVEKNDKGHWESLYVGPDLKTIDAVVLTLRFFIQNNEPTSLANMAALYPTLPVHPSYVSQFLGFRDDLNRFLDSPSETTTPEGRILTRREVLEMFVYGSLAHSNPDKRRLCEQIMNHPYFVIAQLDLVVVLRKFVSMIWGMGLVNASVLEDLGLVRR